MERRRSPRSCWSNSVLKAMIDVIVNKRFLCRVYRFFDGMQLLSDIQAGAVCFHHLDDVAQVAFCSLDSFHNFRVRLMNLRCFHNGNPILVGGIWSITHPTTAVDRVSFRSFP